jgi:hypothetical protein
MEAANPSGKRAESIHGSSNFSGALVLVYNRRAGPLRYVPRPGNSGRVWNTWDGFWLRLLSQLR